MNKSVLKLLSEMKLNKMEFQPSLLKSGYTTPTLIQGYGALYYLCDRPPTISEPDLLTSIPDFSYWWVDQTNNEIYWGLDNTSDAMIWGRVVTDRNILTVLNGAGWNINTARNYAASGIFLDTARQPSLTNDTTVVTSIKQVNVLLSTTEIVAEVSPDNSTWTLAGSIGDDAGVVSSHKNCLSFSVPAGYYYRLRTAITGGGTITLVSCNELSQ